MKYIFLIALSLGIQLIASAQDNPDYLLWNASHKLSVNDFGIKKGNSVSGLCFATITLDYNVNGFDFMTKNFNKKVRNFIIKSASWIDTTQYVDASLRYQQALFDIAEIYTRQFRKELKENRKQIAKGLSIVEEINAKISSEFAKRRLQFETETNTGNEADKLLQWEQQIQQELNALGDYEYNR